MKRKLTDLQRASLKRAVAAYPDYIRSTYAGERVTLASLHRRGWVTRRAWRGAEGKADSAFEYRASDQLMEAIRRRREA